MCMCLCGCACVCSCVCFVCVLCAYRLATEAVPQAPAAPAHLDRDRDGPDGAGPPEGEPPAVPAEGREAAPGRGEEGTVW